MKANFDILKTTRQFILNSVKDLSLDTVNKIPANFKNNIAWNVAHILATQQLLTYGLSDTEMLLDSKFIDSYRKGTAPSENLNQEDWNMLLSLLSSLAEELEADYNNKLFQNFTTYPTSYGYELRTIENAIAFNNVHEALHLGYIMALKKAL